MIDDRAYWNPYVAGVVLGLVLFAAFVLTGGGLGGSGGLARVTSELTAAVAPGYVRTHPTLAAQVGGANAAWGHPMVFMTLGVLAGGFLSGLLAGRLKVETRRGPQLSAARRVGFAVVGGIIAGFAARLARGCTSGQALTGGATLSLGSWIFMGFVFFAAYVLAYPLRRLWN